MHSHGIHQRRNAVLKPLTSCYVKLHETGNLAWYVSKKIQVTVVLALSFIRESFLNPFGRQFRSFFEVDGPIKQLEICNAVSTIGKNFNLLVAHSGISEAGWRKSALWEHMVDVELMVLEVNERGQQRQ